MTKRSIDSWIKTPCGRAKYAELKSKTGVFSQIRLYWFVIFAALFVFEAILQVIPFQISSEFSFP